MTWPRKFAHTLTFSTWNKETEESEGAKDDVAVVEEVGDVAGVRCKGSNTQEEGVGGKQKKEPSFCVPGKSNIHLAFKVNWFLIQSY